MLDAKVENDKIRIEDLYLIPKMWFVYRIRFRWMLIFLISVKH